MSTPESHSHDTNRSPDDSSNGQQPNQRCEHDCHDTVDQQTRQQVLEEYDYKCQTCGRRGPERGGLASLHVHHIERDTGEMDEHDMDNLTLLCRSCHTWYHQQSTPQDSPVTITEEDQSVLLPQDIEILRTLYSNGPKSTSEIASDITTNKSVAAVRERLWVLAGLDNLVESREKQIVDKDLETGNWGLTEQIETSVRGHIPDDPQLLVQRVEDEQVRQAIERGCGRREVMEVLGIARKTSYNKHRRACAFDFPLDVFSRGGGLVDYDSDDSDAAGADQNSDTSDEQQRLDSVKDNRETVNDRTRLQSKQESETESSPPEVADASMIDEANSDQARKRLEHAMDVLNDMEQLL